MDLGTSTAQRGNNSDPHKTEANSTKRVHCNYERREQVKMYFSKAAQHTVCFNGNEGVENSFL